MRQRGRKSAAALEVVPPSSVVEMVKRPAPPDDLTDEEADEWQAVVGRLAADWFPRETHGLLANYCRHTVRARRVSQMVSAAEGEPDLDILKLDRLYKMAERESRAASALATRLRITLQATRSAKDQKPVTVAKPWEFEG